MLITCPLSFKEYMVVTLQQVSTVAKDYIVSKLANSYTGIKRMGICLGAELLGGYISKNGLALKNDITIGAGLFTEKNNINLENAKQYLSEAIRNCGAFSIELPFGLPTVTIEPTDVEELYNLLRPMAINET